MELVVYYLGQIILSQSYNDFFYVDLTDVLLLDTNTVIDRTKWIDLSVINPQPIGCFSCYPLLNGKDNDKIFYFNTGGNFRISVFDTKLNKWGKIEQDLKVYLKRMQIPDFWINTVDETPGERVKYTAVLNTDGRVIVFSGVSNLLPAPQSSTLDTSKTPYE
ncbi:unnamed protein product [Rhizophagus irregularis]|nr:unnamed protein product [Rhizophagus irregularis]